jgi:hypothetical protein
LTFPSRLRARSLATTLPRISSVGLLRSTSRK